MLAIIASVLGITGTLCAWFLNPRRRLYSEIDQVYKDLEKEYTKRDEALFKNDADSLTIATANIIRLCARKTDLLQRLG